MAAQSQEHYFLPRDMRERDRLNHQSKVMLGLCSGQVIDPIIPKHTLHKIADVGTGTGIWIEEASEELTKSGNHEFEFVGFDVSPALFHTQDSSRVKLELADFHQGFPEHYHGTFDLVHVRYIIAAVESGKLEIVVANILKLLKPNGYLQWTETNLGDHEALIWPAGNPDSLVTEGAVLMNFIDSMKWSRKLIGEIVQLPEFLRACEVLQIQDHIQASFEKKELHETLWTWHAQTFGMMMKGIVLRSGGAVEDAEETEKAYIAKAERMGRAGTVMANPIMTLVARKKSG